jgi:hypothetical protein
MEKKVYRMTIDETDNESGVFAISLVRDPAISELWVALSKQQHVIKLAQVGDKRELIGLVLVPDREILRIDENGEEYYITFPTDVVAKAAELYLKRQYNNSATIEHQESVEGISVTESWIVENPEIDKTKLYGIDAPQGSWAIKMKIYNEDIWENYVKTSDIRGFSLEGLFGYEPISMSSVNQMSEEDKIVNEIKSLLSEYSTNSI